MSTVGESVADLYGDIDGGSGALREGLDFLKDVGFTKPAF